MATIVNTTEEEPMLAVVCFTAELTWAHAGPEVTDFEVTRLCLKAQEDILARRWLNIASERIKMPKRGVNWAFLKINCKN
jgi:translation initiation factor 3 subunit M